MLPAAATSAVETIPPTHHAVFCTLWPCQRSDRHGTLFAVWPMFGRGSEDCRPVMIKGRMIHQSVRIILVLLIRLSSNQKSGSMQQRNVLLHRSQTHRKDNKGQSSLTKGDIAIAVGPHYGEKEVIGVSDGTIEKSCGGFLEALFPVWPLRYL